MSTRWTAPRETGRPPPEPPDRLHPAWRAFIRMCAELRHCDIERLSIQDGVPVFAETVRKKVKF